MSLPADFGTGTVTGHWVTSRGLDARGRVVFTPRPNFMVSVGEQMIVLPNPVTATLRDGAISVVLPATDDVDITPVGWTWRVECQISGLDIAPFDIVLPEGSTVDLSSVVEVDAGSGTTITTGPTGPQGEPGVVAATGLATYDAETQTIDVTATAADVGAVPAARTITAGTGLTGGGDLAADRTISADLSSSNGAALGTAAPGVATTIARADHVHPMPSASDVGGVPVSLIDAAGDLIVGTAADTVGRVALGAAGTVLTSDGTTAGWERDHMPYNPDAGGFLSTNHPLGGNNDAYLSGGVTWTGLWLEPGEYDQIGLWVVVAGTGSLTVRIGIDADQDGYPWGATNLLDAGTIDLTSATGLRMITLGTNLVIDRPQWTWARAQYESGTGTTTAVRTVAGDGQMASWPPRPGMSSSAVYNNRGYVGFRGITVAPDGFVNGAMTPYTRATGRTPNNVGSWRPWVRRVS